MDTDTIQRAPRTPDKTSTTPTPPTSTGGTRAGTIPPTGTPRRAASIPRRTLVLAALALAALGAADAATVVVTPTDMDTWHPSHSHCEGGASTGSQAFVPGPPDPPLGTGSLQLTTGADGASFETFRNTALAGTLLSDLTALSYSAWTTDTGGQAVYLNLLVSSSGDGGVDNQLFFEPVYQTPTFNPSLPDQGPIEPGTWQTWDALAGGWWDLNGFAGPGTGVRSLDDFIAAFPDATVSNSATGLGGVRLAVGCGSEEWAGFMGNADNVTLATAALGSTTYDFEVMAPAPPTTTSSPPPTTSTATTGTESSTPAIPFFPTTATIVIALGAALVGGLVILRRRR